MDRQTPNDLICNSVSTAADGSDHNGAFCDFKPQSIWSELRLPQQFFDFRNQVGLQKLFNGKIDAHGEGRTAITAPIPSR